MSSFLFLFLIFMISHCICTFSSCLYFSLLSDLSFISLPVPFKSDLYDLYFSDVFFPFLPFVVILDFANPKLLN